MGKLTLKFEDDTLDRLKALATSLGRTPEEEAERLVSKALWWEDEWKRRQALLRRMEETGAMSPPIRGVDITALIREDRDR